MRDVKIWPGDIIMLPNKKNSYTYTLSDMVKCGMRRFLGAYSNNCVRYKTFVQEGVVLYCTSL